MSHADIHNMKRIIIFLFIVTGIAAFSAAQTPGSEPFRQEGIASWYGREFDGKPTASGELFNSAFFTAAHPTMPFGTVLIITNTQNKLRVAVRVNDRGPFVANRIIDLSRAAAEALDMLAVGTAQVIVEQAGNIALGPVRAVQAPVIVPVVTVTQTPPPAPPVPTLTPAPSQIVPQGQTTFQAAPAQIRGTIPEPGSTNLYRLQVGSYRIPRNAVEVFERLRNSGLSPAYERNGAYYRVVLAGLRAGEIPSIAQVLGNAGFREVLIRQETGH